MTHIKTRGGTAAEWTSANPVLLENEIGIEEDTLKLKRGNGVTAWDALPYASVPPASPVFTGSPQAPTPPAGNNTTRIATTQFVQGELAGKAPTASPVFTGDPKAPTPAPGDDDTSIANTAWVNDAIAAVVADALDTAKLAAHPIGSILTTLNSANPSTYIGGTWVQYAQGTVLVGQQGTDTDFDTPGETGGAKTHDHDLDTSSSGARLRLGADNIIRGLIKSGVSRVYTREQTVTSGTTVSTATTTMIALEGQSSVESNMPPYTVVYFWRRTA